MAHSPLIERASLLAIATEVTPGVAETLDATDAAFNVFDAVLGPNITMARRPGQGGWVDLPHKAEQMVGECSFRAELYGGAVSPALWHILLPACGWGFSSTKYLLDKRNPAITGSTQKTLTIGHYQDGTYKILFGAQGNLKLIGEAGKVVAGEFTFIGKYVPRADLAILAPTYEVVAR